MKKYKLSVGVLLLFIIASVILFNVKNNKDYNENLGHTSLYVETYLADKNQLTHPNVIKFDKPWHGYKYWMGYTPYPNPIADNEETGCNELKDSQLIYRDDLDRLEI